MDGLEALQNRLPEVLQRSVERRLSLESERVDKLVHNIVHASTSKFHNALLALSKLKEVTYQAFNHRIRKYADHLKATQFKILTELDRFIKVKNECLLKVESNVRSLDPKPWLAKGWTKFVFDGGRSVRSASDVSVGELGKAIMIDGDITVKIEKIEMRT